MQCEVTQWCRHFGQDCRLVLHLGCWWWYTDGGVHRCNPLNFVMVDLHCKDRWAEVVEVDINDLATKCLTECAHDAYGANLVISLELKKTLHAS